MATDMTYGVLNEQILKREKNVQGINKVEKIKFMRIRIGEINFDEWGRRIS